MALSPRPTAESGPPLLSRESAQEGSDEDDDEDVPATGGPPPRDAGAINTQIDALREQESRSTGEDEGAALVHLGGHEGQEAAPRQGGVLNHLATGARPAANRRGSSYILRILMP